MTDRGPKRSLNGEGERICRRSFLKAGISTLAGVAASMLTFNNSPDHPSSPPILSLGSKAHAAVPGSFRGCRTVVFGSDSLRDDYANALHEEEAPALNRLLGTPGVTGGRNVICSLSDGVSVTESGWAEIWSAMPAKYNKAYDNGAIHRMPDGAHLVDKIAYCDAKRTAGVDVYIGWVTGKLNISGRHSETPHAIVNEGISKGHLIGTYYGDQGRENQDVSNLAAGILNEALAWDNFLCFIHFKDPDETGHNSITAGVSNPHSTYLDKAMEIDQRISDLMNMLPESSIPFKFDNGIYTSNPNYNPASSDFVNVIYCSDHGFNFTTDGNWMGHFFEADWVGHHRYSPRGMLATNFATIPRETIQQMSIGRLIYALTGGNPNVVKTRSVTPTRYQLGGEDLL